MAQFAADFLLSLAIEGLYRPVWSGVVLAELEYEEAAKLVTRGSDPTVAKRRACHLVAQMRSAFDDALVVGWEGLEGSYGLPDPDDEHVVAAAVVANAGVIVTENLKDFPVDCLPVALDVVRPDQFATSTVAISLWMTATSPSRARASVPISAFNRESPLA